MTSGVQGSSARLDEDRSANTELERVRSAATYLSSRSRRRIDSRPYTHTVSRPHDAGHAGFPSDREGALWTTDSRASWAASASRAASVRADKSGSAPRLQESSSWMGPRSANGCADRTLGGQPLLSLVRRFASDLRHDR